MGRMINSGQNIASSETGGWTSFNQDNPCSGGTNAQEVQGPRMRRRKSGTDCPGAGHGHQWRGNPKRLQQNDPMLGNPKCEQDPTVEPHVAGDRLPLTMQQCGHL